MRTYQRDGLKFLGAALAAATVVTVGWIPSAHAELVYEEAAPAQAAPSAVQKQETIRIEDRTTLRQAIQSSEKAQSTVQAQAPVAAPAPVQYAPAPVLLQSQVVETPQAATSVVPVGPASEVENVSKSELVRRQRVRQELKNEDMLQERLEDLRLRDEQRRTQGLITAMPLAADGSAQAAPAAPVVAPVQAVQPATVVVTPAAAQETAVPATELKSSKSTEEKSDDEDDRLSSRATMKTDYAEDSDKTLISVEGRGGVPSMKANPSYQVNGHFSAGVALSAELSDHVAVEFGYTYSEYGIALASGNPLAQNPNAIFGGNTGNFENYALKQNVIDAGLKFYLLGRDSKFRPFLGGGAAYSKGYVNYNQNLLQLQAQNGIPGTGDDYQISSYLGMVDGGFDLKLSKNVSLGAVFKYYTVLSSNESAPLNNGAFYSGAPYANPYQAMSNADKQVLGGSLAVTGFYDILIGASFTF